MARLSHSTLDAGASGATVDPSVAPANCADASMHDGASAGKPPASHTSAAAAAAAGEVAAAIAHGEFEFGVPMAVLRPVLSQPAPAPPRGGGDGDTPAAVDWDDVLLAIAEATPPWCLVCKSVRCPTLTPLLG